MNQIQLKVLLLLFSLIFIFSASPVYAATPCDNDTSIAAGQGPCPAGLDQLESIVGNVISVIVGLGFIAMFVLLIMAGIKYLTSGGEPKAIQSAHYTLTWALLGLFMMAVAWLALQLIAGFTGIEVTIFNIKALCKSGGDLLKFCQPN